MDKDNELIDEVTKAFNKRELEDMPSDTVTDTDYIPNQNPVAQDYTVED